LDAKIYELRAKIEAQKRPPPDYEKWRHVPKMNLRTTAQLWSDEQPNMKLVGEPKESYEMLRGVILKGELLLELAGPIDPRMESAARAVAAQNPTSETMVTREALKAFAARHKYDPRFLRGK
jgi:hypothetical protein